MDRAQPGAIDSLVRNYELGDALGQFSGGWVAPASEPTASAQRSDLDETAFTAFDQTSSSSSLTVTIGPGEAFVDGWLATDTPTDVDLAASTAGQTVGVSWDPDAVYDPDTDADRDAADRVVVALEGDISSVDPFLPLWTFDTDGSGVTAATDTRQLGPSINAAELAGADISAAPSGEFLRKASEGLEFGDIETGAITQENEPSNPDNGDLWYDTSSGIFRVYGDLGGGADWHSIPPVQVLEEASIFTESDVTVTQTNTEIANGSIELGSAPQIVDDVEDDDTNIEAAEWSGWSFTFDSSKGSITSQSTTVLSGSYSIEFESQDGFPIVTAEKSSQITGNAGILLQIADDIGEEVQIRIENTSGESIGTLQFNGGSDVIWKNLAADPQVLSSWSAGVTYDIDFDFDFPNNQLEITINGTTKGPFDFRESTDHWNLFQIQNLTDDTGSTRSIFFDNFTAAGPATSGDALIEWDSGAPTVISSYDLSTFQRTLDSETVTIDVEDGDGNVLFSDIGRNFDISTVDTNKNVRLRANLSRNDTANNPTLDYAARRFTR